MRGSPLVLSRLCKKFQHVVLQCLCEAAEVSKCTRCQKLVIRSVAESRVEDKDVAQETRPAKSTKAKQRAIHSQPPHLALFSPISERLFFSSADTCRMR
ncbi:unnamed protein product [Diplocarpon coronariae]